MNLRTIPYKKWGFKFGFGSRYNDRLLVSQFQRINRVAHRPDWFV